MSQLVSCTLACVVSCVPREVLTLICVHSGPGTTSRQLHGRVQAAVHTYTVSWAVAA